MKSIQQVISVNASAQSPGNSVVRASKCFPEVTDSNSITLKLYNVYSVRLNEHCTNHFPSRHVKVNYLKRIMTFFQWLFLVRKALQSSLSSVQRKSCPTVRG